jgi:shikimate dehydrogenase
LKPISGTTRVVGVVGMPVRHSLSPAIVNAAFDALGVDWSYFAFEVAPDDIDAAVEGMRALQLGGLSVTMPHKERVAELVDRCSADAATLGAVNCIVRDGDDLIGENTDGPGFVDALKSDLNFDPVGRRAVVLGAGGAARAVVLALARAGAADVAVVNRTRSNAERAVALAGPAGRVAAAEDAVPEADLVVNATPLGMTEGGMAIDPGLLRPRHALVDLIYHPSTTLLLAAAAERGCAVANGLGMLVHQAAHAVRLWTGLDPPVDTMRQAAKVGLDQRTNVDIRYPDY